MECNKTESGCRYYTENCKSCKQITEIEGVKFCGKCDSNVALHQRIRTELNIKGINCLKCEYYTKNLNSAKCLECFKMLKEKENEI